MKKKTIVLIKFMIFVAIFYALLAFNVFHIGEKLVPISTDYVEIDTSQEDKNLEETYLEIDTTTQEQTGHFAASTNTLEDLCRNIQICNKISFNGKFLEKEKYNYTKYISKIVDFINKNNTQKKPIDTTIHTIEINKGNGERRGYADWNNIVFNLGSVQSQKEFIELSTHEIGHITDLGYLQGPSSKKDKNYTEFNKIVFAIDDLSLVFYKISRESESIRKAETKKKDFCSGYGMSDPFEDFAECFNLYTNHNSFFKQIAKSNIKLRKKYNFIAGIFSGQYISSNSQDLTLIKSNITRRPRDTTKINN